MLDLLIDISEGDLRRSINTLQTCSSFVKVGDSPAAKLKTSDIEKISGIVPNSVVESIYKTLKKTSDYSEVQQVSESLILEGFDVQQLIGKIMQYFID